MELDLRKIIEGLANSSGQEFFDRITLIFASAINADYVFIAKLDLNKRISVTISLAAKGETVDNFEYALKDTPCSNVADDSICCYPDNVISYFPKDQLLIDMNIKSYIGSPLHDSKGNVIGLTVALSEKPIVNEETVTTLFKIFSGRIAVEIERTEQEIEISRLNQVVNQNPFSTIITDNQGVIEYVNAKCQTMTGYFGEELIGKKMSIFCSGHHHRDFYQELWNTISVQKKMWRGIITNKMKNDQNLDCSSNIFPLFDADNNIVNFVTVQEDVTEQNIKDNLFLMQTRQAQMGEMLSMIAHQWRQPLAVISAVMNKQRIDIELGNHAVDEFVKSITDVDTQVQYLSRTISDFRDFFKPDKEKTSTTTAQLFIKVLGLIGHTLINENIEVIQTHQHDEPYMTYEHEMVQVILNLFKNSQDVFSERNISNRQLIITSDQLNNQCIISVEDNAGGIDISVMNTLFLPYISTKTKQNGTGLGLYMSKTIVEEHCQGVLRVENTQNGAKFTMQFPIKDCDGTL